MGIVDAVEDLEKAKSKLDDLRFGFEQDEKWDLAESLEEYISSIQLIIDTLTDDEDFASKPVEGDEVACDCEVICDHVESCTQKLVGCDHQKLHGVKRFGTKLRCTLTEYCSVAEIGCKCIIK